MRRQSDSDRVGQAGGGGEADGTLRRAHRVVYTRRHLHMGSLHERIRRLLVVPAGKMREGGKHMPL